MAAQGNSFFSANAPPTIVLWSVYYESFAARFVLLLPGINSSSVHRDSQLPWGTSFIRYQLIKMKETFKHKMLPSIFSESQDQGDGEAETDNLARRQSHVSTRVPRYVGTLDTK